MSAGFPTRQVSNPFASSRWFKSSDAQQRRPTNAAPTMTQTEVNNDDIGRYSSSQGLPDMSQFSRPLTSGRPLTSSQYGYLRDGGSQHSQGHSTQSSQAPTAFKTGTPSSSQAPFQDMERNLVEFDVMKQLVTSIDDRLSQLQGKVHQDLQEGAQTWKKIEELVTRLQEVTSRIEVFQTKTTSTVEELRCQIAEVQDFHRELKTQKMASSQEAPSPSRRESQLFEKDEVWIVDDNNSECCRHQTSNPRKRRISQVKLEKSEPDASMVFLTPPFFELAIPEPKVLAGSHETEDKTHAGVLTEVRKTRRQRKLEDSEITVPLEFFPFRDFLQPKKSRDSHVMKTDGVHE